MSTLIKNCLKKKNPIWLMRQAGRYLPEYQLIRRKQKNFINFCLNINAATKVTLQPINRFDLDAAIIFSDILIIPYGLGQQVEFKENIGPVLSNYNLDVFKKKTKYEFIEKIKNVYKAINKTRSKLSKRKSLIGFVGSPWTILVYVLNGKSPKKQITYKKILKNKEEIKELFQIIEKFVLIHAEEQIKAGADTIQLFDSWAGLINSRDLKEFCFNPTKRIIKKLKQKYPKIPIICFPRGIGKKIKEFCKVVKPNVLSIDSKIGADFVLKNINKKIIIQGGMDPKFLLKGGKLMKQKALYYLNKFNNRSYIFNLGHGVIKETKPEAVQQLVNIVREFNERSFRKN